VFWIDCPVYFNLFGSGKLRREGQTHITLFWSEAQIWTEKLTNCDIQSCSNLDILPFLESSRRKLVVRWRIVAYRWQKYISIFLFDPSFLRTRPKTWMIQKSLTFHVMKSTSQACLPRTVLIYLSAHEHVYSNERYQTERRLRSLALPWE